MFSILPMAPNNFRIEADGNISVSTAGRVGLLGEAIAAQWVLTYGWHILHHRWHCRWGELDLITQDFTLPTDSQKYIGPNTRYSIGKQIPYYAPNSSQQLVFIEVKTRSLKNWDANGLMAITPKKQQKLWKTAEFFLATFPQYANAPCRFDLMLIRYQRSPQDPRMDNRNPDKQVPSPTASRISETKTLSHQNEAKPTRFNLNPFNANQSVSPWIRLGHHQFRLEHHLKNVFER